MTRRTPGPWIRLATDLHTNPKILHLAHTRQHRAINVYLFGLTWCGANQLDGWIPDFALPQIHGTRKDATQLEDVGLWQPNPGGWWIHDWNRWQESSEDKNRRTERMRNLALKRHHAATEPTPPRHA